MIYKALQKTLVAERQFNCTPEELFTKGTHEHSIASVSRAEEIIRAAKKIIKKQNLGKARDARKKKMEWISKTKETKN